MPKVKICCIKNLQEAMMAIKFGASALGFVSEMPSGPGVIEEEEIRSIISQIPSAISSFLLSSKTSSIDLIRQLEYTGANTLQIVDYVGNEVYKDLRDFDQSITLVQVIHVIDKDDIYRAMEAAKHVDMILLDSGKPKAREKTLGGTGITHDWNLSTEIVKQLDIPVFLAGGLKPSNVRQAMDQVPSYGLDLCSGVRTNGLLDESLLSVFMNEVNGKN